MKKETPVDALVQAVANAGGQSALAEKLTAISPKPVSQARVWNWINRDLQAPAELCPLIEQITAVACERLRPDVAWDVVRQQAAPATQEH